MHNLLWPNFGLQSSNATTYCIATSKAAFGACPIWSACALVAHAFVIATSSSHVAYNAMCPCHMLPHCHCHLKGAQCCSFFIQPSRLTFHLAPSSTFSSTCALVDVLIWAISRLTSGVCIWCFITYTPTQAYGFIKGLCWVLRLMSLPNLRSKHWMH